MTYFSNKNISFVKLLIKIKQYYINMGNESSKKSKEITKAESLPKDSKNIDNKSGNNHVIQHKNELNELDFEFLVQQTNLSRTAIQDIFDMFIKNNPDAKLDKQEFARIYNELRPEPAELLDEISEHVFRAFDVDRNGLISFNEFMIAYALTSRGDLKKKLEYAFMLYDLDGSGYLNNNELKTVLGGMLDLLGAEKEGIDGIAEQCLKELDVSQDGRVSQTEFVDGLLRNYSLRSLMSPFN